MNSRLPALAGGVIFGVILVLVPNRIEPAVTPALTQAAAPAVIPPEAPLPTVWLEPQPLGWTVTANALPVTASPKQIDQSERPVSPLTEWPSIGPVSQVFGCSLFYSGIPGPGCPAEAPWFHDGVDLAVPAGTPVRAGLTGTVVFAGPDSSGPNCGQYRGYGLSVVIANQTGWQTLYAHLGEVKAKVGQQVRSETIIGGSGATGCVSGPHLHFGLRHQGGMVDPQDYLPDR